MEGSIGDVLMRGVRTLAHVKYLILGLFFSSSFFFWEECGLSWFSVGIC